VTPFTVIGIVPVLPSELLSSTNETGESKRLVSVRWSGPGW
jgi:hypothetical protein